MFSSYTSQYLYIAIILLILFEICIAFALQISYDEVRGGDTVPNYKLLYATMFNTAEDAINILIDAQQRCEKMYMDQPEVETELKIVGLHQEAKKDEE